MKLSNLENINIVTYMHHTRLAINPYTGDPVQKTKQSHPYSYDPVILWEEGYKKGKSTNGSAYSDRLYSWNSEKFNECCQKVWGNRGQMFDRRSPYEIEDFLSLYLDKDVKLTRIVEECNISNGFPVWVFSWEDK